MKFILDVWDDVLVYLITLLGVLASEYIKMFKSGSDFQIDVKFPQLAIASVIALLFVLQAENDNPGVTKEQAKKGKRLNLRRRLSLGLLHGMVWTQIVGE